MRHRLLAFLLVVALLVAAVAMGFTPLSAIAAFLLLGLGAAAGLAVLVALGLFLHGVVFERRVSRWHRFN